MEITTYRELQSKNELLPLMDQAFEWPFNPVEFGEIIKADPRLQHSPVGYAATGNNHLAGFVGVMDLTTRTLDGEEETVGGIWGVVTHPAHGRKGVSTVLMQRSLQYFKEKGYRFSLLTTWRPLIAYAYYQKLGSKEAIVYPSVYKLIEERRELTDTSTEKAKLDWDKILKIYNEATENRTGLVVRDRQYGTMLEARKRIQPEKSIVADEGYALLKAEEGNVAIQEIIALTIEETGKLINLIEEKAAKAVIDRAVLDNQILDSYRSRGYMVLEDSYNVLMAKPMDKIGFSEVYGDKFYMTNGDSF